VDPAITELTNIIDNTLSYINTIATFVGVIVGLLAVAIAIINVIAAIRIWGSRESLRRIEQIREEILEIRAKYQKLTEKENLELMRQYLNDLNNENPGIRFHAINALSEIGDYTCIAILFKIIESPDEEQSNVKAAEETIIAIARRERAIPEPILHDLGIEKGFIDIILDGFRQTIENIQKQRNMRKLKERRK